MDQLKITLEVLYDLLRNEKKREDLQKLDSTFYADVVLYLREKKAILDKQDTSEEHFGVVEREKLQGELRSIKRIIREMYEKREKKIIEIALNRSKTGSEIIDTSSMLIEEKLYYDRLLVLLDSQRRGVMHSLLRAEIPIVSDLVNFSRVTDASLPEQDDDSSGLGSVHDEGYGVIHGETRARSGSETVAAVRVEVEPGMSKVRVTVPIPSFMWKDLKVYGPFDVGEEMMIFSEVADLLVRKGRAIKM